MIRWWGIGRGYFRNVLAEVLLLLLVATLVMLVGVRRVLAPLMITSEQNNGVSFDQRVLVRSDSIPSCPMLGDWLVFAEICDSCSEFVRRNAALLPRTCASVEQLYWQVQHYLAIQLNRYGWGAHDFRYYLQRVLSLYLDSIPSTLRWMEPCTVEHVALPAPPTLKQDSALRDYIVPFLQGRLWWIQLGLADRKDSTLSAGSEGQ